MLRGVQAWEQFHPATHDLYGRVILGGGVRTIAEMNAVGDPWVEMNTRQSETVPLTALTGPQRKESIASLHRFSVSQSDNGPNDGMSRHVNQE